MSRGTRVLSIDLLRGLDVLLMLFVNEMAGVRGTPAFLLHMPASADGMTVTDVVFPAFLFLTGMAIPLALGCRLRAGEPPASVWRHVLMRTAGLLVIGVFMINAERASAEGPVPPAVWNLLMTAGAVLVWMTPPAESVGGRPARRVRVAGLAILVVLAFLYRADGLTGIFQLRPYWWGILGLIGWAYFVAAATYLLAGDRPWILAAVTVLLYGVFLADEMGTVSAFRAVRPVVSIGRMLGSHAALVLSGALLSVLLLRPRPEGRPPAPVVPGALGYAAALGLAGLALHAAHDVHPAFTISKVRATAAWCLLSASVTTVAWAIVYGLVDVRGWRRWPPVVREAGENALVVYLLAPFLHSVFALAAVPFGRNPYSALGGSLALGIVRSVMFAGLVVWLAGWMRRRGLILRL